MAGFTSVALWFARRLTGYRTYHLFVLSFLLVIVLVGLAIPFWWLGEQANAIAGLPGVALVFFSYLSSAAVVLVAAAIAVGRLVIGRIRRSLQLSRQF